MFKILIVDDTKTVHAFVKNFLLKCKDIEVTSVFDGQQAVETMKSNNTFDLVLLDWEMPRLTGPETFAEFLKMGIKTPTVMMTTKNAPEDIQKMLEMGVSEYLMKPFTCDILFEKIEFVSGRSFNHAA